MAYADDAVRAKLSALNETQESIVSVAQWIIFHRRHADRTAELWLEKLKEANTSKKLNLIYLANEVVQQSKARKKEDFLLAFSPIVADATATAYKGATQEVQQKIRRVVEVWRQRSIFELAIQEATEKRIDELDKTRSARSGGGSRLGGSLFGNTSSVPSELQALVQPQTTLARLDASGRALINTANTEYAKLTDPAVPLPTPPVHAARLSSLLKSLATAEGAVSDSMKARKELISGLEKLLQTNRARLAEEEASASDFSSRRESIEAKKKDIEDGIMRGLSADSFASSAPHQHNGSQSLATGENPQHSASPDVEGFTPPPPDVETFTPTGSPGAQPAFPADERAYPQSFPESSTFAADPIQEQRPQHDEPTPALEPPPSLATNASNASSTSGMLSGADSLLSSLALPQVRTASHSPSTNGASTDPRLKRRKMSHKSADMDEEIFGGGEGVGIDQDVAAMLGAQ
ncbi:hypothetical protein MBLNU459_g4292t1 [Dothideomycetes sp. NU459]